MNSFVRYNERTENYETFIIYMAQMAYAGVCHLYVFDYRHDDISQLLKIDRKTRADAFHLHYVPRYGSAHLGVVARFLRQKTVHADTDSNKFFPDARFDHPRRADRKL